MQALEEPVFHRYLNEEVLVSQIEGILSARLRETGLPDRGYATLFDAEATDGLVPVMLVKLAPHAGPHRFWIDFEFHDTARLPSESPDELSFHVWNECPAQGGLLGLACIALDAATVLEVGQKDSGRRYIRASADMRCEIDRVVRVHNWTRSGAGGAESDSPFDPADELDSFANREPIDLDGTTEFDDDPSERGLVEQFADFALRRPERTALALVATLAASVIAYAIF
ncbi:hypothetical protein CKO28_14170 [Rhodovibrio sodomensis]|uniref:Uncharacterized protein n=2 Tax=Rhodovibrio sodomensis TaxID=1088 RepID=A0ABS1DG16_9PROT|nr:hypothetical protein [Rhodovibrio sodomensis]